MTVGLIGALRRRGLSVGAFKKGPDYIDAGWLGLAAGQCFNLDTYLFSTDMLISSFLFRSQGKDIAVVEGNRGLFDGVDAVGSYSTAELAKLLEAPILLIIDCTKMTRTAAALVLGACALDEQPRGSDPEPGGRNAARVGRAKVYRRGDVGAGIGIDSQAGPGKPSSTSSGTAPLPGAPRSSGVRGARGSSDPAVR